jgi:hypothetical protein
VKHNVRGLTWSYYQPGLFVSVKPLTNGPCYRLERTIYAKSGNHYWEAWWCPEWLWQKPETRVYLGRARTHVGAAIHAELHDATQPDRYYAMQLKEES